MKKQILIVEDNELNRTILCEILSGEYQILEAWNGREALDVLYQHKDSIALILLDVMMPVMDGYTFLDRIRNDSELSLIPVIVMTQSNSEEDEVSALAHGATDFVPKPYRPQVILHRVASLIRLRENAAMINQFQYDRLTGLYSKEFFYQKAREQLLENPEVDYCIVSSNIENFKLVNDIFGTQEGDRLLKEVAGVAEKVVGSTGFCGRYSADRFLCLQKRKQELLDPNSFVTFSELEISPLLKSVVMRWGIYEITDRSIPVEHMCDRALLAADSIKGQYNQYSAVYDDSLRSKLLREQTITKTMESALAGDQFVVYFQPKYSLNDETMSGAEALVRWIHPELGLISPGEFIPLFEKNGFISRLDQYVWEQVCTKLRDWQDKGYPLVPVSVNVSRSDVYQSNLADTLLNLTRKYGIDPAYLHLEITESAYAENLGQIVSAVEELRKQGFIIEMDDFGSGYSSLNMLSRMNLDILKLDMEFIHGELAKSVEQSILNDIITMAHRMHLSVVVEGVETREQVNRLRGIDCDYVQGYFFARPMPAPEFEELMKKQRQMSDRVPLRALQGKPEMQTLLVVDENADYREQVRNIFAEQYRVLEASDHESALACIRSLGRGGIAAVILSMTLPEDGAAALLDFLRSEMAFRKIPVLATIPNGESMKELPLAMETDDFICKCHPMFDLNRRVQRLVDIVSLRMRESVLEDNANRDSLTTLLNRRGLQAAVSALRKEDMPLALCLFDLDNLKKANDTYGHITGDRILCDFAELLRSKTGPDDICCRYGGDEFILVLRQITDPDDAMTKCTEICQSFRERAKLLPVPVACSGGIVLCEEIEQLFTEMLERADRALYRAKDGNKGGCCLWQES